MNLKTMLYREMLKLPPKHVSERLLRSEATLSAAGLLGNRFGARTLLLYSTLARTLATAPDETEVAILPEDEKPAAWHITRTPQGVRLRAEGSEETSVFHELNLLDLDPERRTSCFEQIAAQALPMLPSEAQWRARVLSGPLSPFQLHELIGHLRQVADERLRALAVGVNRKEQVGVKDFIPTGKLYYETLAGPIRPELNGSEYFEQVLCPRIRQVFAKDRAWGWRCAEAAFIGPSVDLHEVFREVPDEDLLPVLKLGEELGSSLAPVAVLTVALPRSQKSPAFLELARRAALQTVARAKKAPSDLGRASLFPAFSLLTLRCLSAEEETWSAPPYWRRLAGMMHAHVLMGMLSFEGVDIRAFGQWVSSAHTGVGEVADYLDAQQEPMHVPDLEHMRSPDFIALGLMLAVCEKSEQGESVLPESERAALKAHFNGLALVRLSSALPDALQGSPRLADQPSATQMEASLGDELVNYMIDGRGERAAWHSLFVFARHMAYTPSLTEKMREWTRGIPGRHPQDLSASLELLAFAARIASVQGDTGLAEAIADTAISISSDCRTAPLASAVWGVLALSAAAHQDRQAWSNWLEEKMTILAYTLARGEACAELARLIDLMHRLTSISERAWSRPRYVAMSAQS